VLAKWVEGNLIADSWIQEKSCRVTIETGVCDHRQTGHRRWAARKGAESAISLTNGFRRKDYSRERGARRADPWAAHSGDLSFRRRYQGRFHPGAGYLADLRHVSGHGTPGATTGPEIGASERRACSVGVNAIEVYR
jgi:hypothetical protein